MAAAGAPTASKTTAATSVTATAECAGRLPSGGVFVLVGGAVFKTVEAEDLGLVGSIPIRLRHLRFCFVRRRPAVAVATPNDLRVPFACITLPRTRSRTGSIARSSAYRAVLGAARSGSLSRGRIRSAVQRVLALKARYGIIGP